MRKTKWKTIETIFYGPNRQNSWIYPIPREAYLQDQIQRWSSNFMADGNQIPKTLKDTFHSLYNAKEKKRKRPNKKHFNKQQSVQALSLPPKSQQEIYTASIDRRDTHIMFYLENHDGSTTNGKYAYEVPSHLFKPFFKKLEQEISDCKSGKGCEVINRNSTQYFPVSSLLQHFSCIILLLQKPGSWKIVTLLKKAF